MPTPTKLLFIGLDAAERDLLLRWSEAGLLPALRSLRERAVLANAPGLPGFGSGAMWPSFASALNPARHGCFFARQIAAGSYDLAPYKPLGARPGPFWNALSRAGRRVAVIDVPYVLPSRALNGIHVVDWGVHSPVFPNVDGWPPEVVSKVDVRFGADQVGSCEKYGPDQEAYQTLLDRLLDRIERKTALACHHLDQGDWDLFLTVFDESHCIGHQCWHLHDPAHPRHDPAMAAEIGDPVHAVYVAIDAAIGRLLKRVGPETAVVLFSCTGMGPNYTGNHLLDEILVRLESAPRSFGRPVVNLLKSLWHKVPQRARGRYRAMGRRLEQSLVRTDWARRSCFTIPHNDISGAIRINLAGREPHGKIRPGAEYEAFREALTRDLLDIVNVETGESMIREVVPVTRLYRGEHLDGLPDLLVVWNRVGPNTTVSSPKIGTLSRPFTANRTGDHTEHGLFVARVPGIAPKKLRRPVSIMDIAPTVAALLGVPLEGVDGKPIEALCPSRAEAAVGAEL